MYQIELGRYASDWEKEPIYISTEDLNRTDDLSFWIEQAKRIETHGKYAVRIVDETGKIYWDKRIPYEGVSINIADEEAGWLDNIRADYGISPELWVKACYVYLNNYEKENK